MMEPVTHLFYMPVREYVGMPENETFGDCMPYYRDGAFHLFYLYKRGIHKTTTRDFVRFTPPQEVISGGREQEQDAGIGTGCVYEAGGRFWFYYTGFSRHTSHEQVVMRAVSEDFIHWTKDSDFRIEPDQNSCGPKHWRDPQCFYSDEDGCHYMAITATEKDGPFRLSATCHLMRSDDGIHWAHYQNLFTPHQYETHECHDFFRMGEWWYMVFSNYTRWWETRYRMAKSLHGPWLAPAGSDMFDGRDFYAAKTVSDGEKHYLVGWQATRDQMNDHEKYRWGGSSLTHELVQNLDGTLSVAPVQAVLESFDRRLPVHPVPRLGSWVQKDGYSCTSPEGFSWLSVGEMSPTCLFSATVRWEPNTRALGLLLHVSDDSLQKWCSFRLEPTLNRIVFERSNRFDVERSFIEERPFYPKKNIATILVITEGNHVVCYVDQVALCSRSYDYQPGIACVFVENGAAAFDGLSLSGQA